jgi:competence protein ComEC
VLYGNIGGFNYLFTGDISKRIEKKIIDNFSSLDVDVLKVSHHGSKTSTSDEFISFITPYYAIISVGKNNIYKHPNEDVLSTLKKYNVTVYRTDTNGTIRFNMKNNNFYFIDTAK